VNGNLKGAIAVVTGGAAGIGKAVAEALLAAGANVSILDRSTDGGPSGAELFQTDMGSDEQVQAAFDSIGRKHGRIDVLINNAGVSYPATVEDGPLEDWHGVFDTNVLGYVRATRAALPFLRQARGASITNVSSCTATTGLRRRVLYSATKGAIEAMSRAMAADFVHEGIRVNCVSPGTVDTPLIGQLVLQAPDPVAQQEVYNNRQPTGFMVSAEEVARAVLYVADPAAVSTVGTVLTVDGGFASIRLFDS
jgi:2-keto-3-deoxy-L-fuconate dehydrogenase